MGNQRKTTVIVTALLTCLSLALSGCSPRASEFVRDDVDFGFIRRVAVFPFYNLSQDIFAAQKVQSIFLTEVLETGQLEVIDRGEMLDAVADLKLAPDMILSPEQVMDLGKRLEADAIFFGTVEEYGLDRTSRDQTYVVTANYSLCEAQTGRTIWSSQVRTDGGSILRKLFGGGSDSLFDVSRANVRAALGKLF
jgi:polysaccharide biosynthesis protein PelC